ncbi:MAG: tetratricopeptide repeat protein [Bacteroidota bacterium]|nr:tetratricopeptide repeat protein [Bacteroidota bacterium]
MNYSKFRLNKYILLINFFLFIGSSFAQQTQIDSLKLALKTAKHDTTRCNILSQLAETAGDDEWPLFNEQLKNLAETNLEILSKSQTESVEFKRNKSSFLNKKFKNYLAISLNNIGFIFDSKGEFNKALEFYTKSLKIREELGDKLGIASALNNIGFIYNSKGDIYRALEFWRKSLKIQEEIGDKSGIAYSLQNIAATYNSQGNIPKALEYSSKCLKISEEIGDKKGIATSLNNIGSIYKTQGDVTKALEYHLKSIKIFEEIGNKHGVAICLVNIGDIHKSRGDLTKALEFDAKSLKIFEEIEDKQGIASTLNNMGVIYQTQNEITKSLEFHSKSLKIREDIGDKKGIAMSLTNIGGLYFNQKNYSKALEYSKKSKKLSMELGFPETIKNAARTLSNIYKAQGEYKNSMDNYELYITMRDSINNQETKKASIKNQLKYEYDKKALADSIQLADTKKLNKAQLAESTAKLEQQKTQRIALIAGLVLVIGFLAYTFKRFRHSQKQKLLIEQQKKLVDESQKKILDSINYAKKIQNSILPSSDEISLYFPNHCLFFKPKDIVSGDFYWFHHRENLSFIAVADCTGHGVPGAFMTMIASSALNEVIIEQKNSAPDKILSSLHSLIFKSLQQHKGDEYSQDGMDISLAVIDKENNVIHFSGAHNHGFLIDNGEIRTLKATQKSIGGLSILGDIEPQRSFKTESYQLNKESVLVLATDGIYDQLNPQDEKFGIKNFKDLILKLNSNSSNDNQTIIEQTYNTWKQETAQLDDILLLSIKL